MPQRNAQPAQTDAGGSDGAEAQLMPGSEINTITGVFSALRIQTTDFPTIGGGSPKEPRRGKRRMANWWTRLLDMVVAFLLATVVCLKDPEWHATVRRSAVTALTWGFVIFALVVFIKGAVWAVAL